MSNSNRVRAGVPTGGQFAAQQRAEPEITLASTNANSAALEDRAADLETLLALDSARMEWRDANRRFDDLALKALAERAQ
jgi:hypothetical protein